MPELTDRLAQLSVLPTTAPTEATVQADLQRARAALKRRRRFRGAAAGVALVAALATAGSLTYVTRSGSSHHSSDRIRLVAYDGAQLPGFTVAEVPDGYVLQGATAYSLDIAQPGDHSSVDAFEGKLVVMLQSRSVKFDTHGTPVTVNGHPGYLREGTPATVLEYTDGTHDIVIQDWQTIPLTDDQLVQFASGVTVTSAAQAGVG